ncbi:hypothetical protein SELMODRAFT_131526, partial [Selaginella moellendorffii]
PLQTRGILYSVAFGHYRNGDYVKSRRLIEQALEIRLLQALILRSLIENKIAKGWLSEKLIFASSSAAVGLDKF